RSSYSTRSRVCGETSERRLTTRDTVGTETPAARAMAVMVTLRPPPGSAPRSAIPSLPRRRSRYDTVSSRASVTRPRVLTPAHLAHRLRSITFRKVNRQRFDRYSGDLCRISLVTQGEFVIETIGLVAARFDRPARSMTGPWHGDSTSRSWAPVASPRFTPTPWPGWVVGLG